MNETTIIDLVDALHSGDGDAVTAASLGRVRQHVQNLNEQHFAILSANRAGLSPAENKARFKKLIQMVRSLGLGYIKLVGHWMECQDEDIEYEDCPEEDLVDSTEPSLFVPGMRLKDAHRIGGKFQQDAIVYGGPDADGNVVLAFRGSSLSPSKMMKIGNKFSPRTIGQGFSELANQQGRGFAFLAYATDSVMEAQSARVYEAATYGRKLYNAVTGGVLSGRTR